MMRLRAALALSVLATQLGAQGGSAKDFTFDPTTGASSGGSSFGRRDTVRLVIKNVNPFLFRYGLDTDLTKVVEASPADFFGAVTSLQITERGAPDPMIAAMDASGLERAWSNFDVMTGVECAGSDAQVIAEAAGLWTLLLAQRAALSLERERLGTSIDDTRTKALPLANGARSAIRTVLDASKATPEVVDMAVKAAAALDGLATLLESYVDYVTPSNTNFSDLVRQFRAESERAVAKFSTCNGFRRIQVASGRLPVDTLAFARAVSGFGSQATDARKASSILRSVASDPTRFQVAVTLPVVRAPKDVAMRVIRCSLRPVTENRGGEGASNTCSPLDTIATFHLQIGGAPRFTISAGMSGSGMPTRTYARLTRITAAVDGLPPDTSWSVIRKENSAVRVVPMLFLQTRLPSVKYIGDRLNLTLGIGSKVDAKPSLDYFLGAAVEFLDERVFLSVGAHIGRAGRLVKGFHVDGELPGGVAEPPVEERTVVYPAIALTFKVLPR